MVCKITIPITGLTKTDETCDVTSGGSCSGGVGWISAVNFRVMVFWVNLDGGDCDGKIYNVDRVDTCITPICDLLPSIKNKVPFFLPSDISLLLLVT